jgi:hypothetical protein
MHTQTSNPRTVATDTGAKVNGTADRGQFTPRPWSSAYPGLTEGTVRERVTASGIGPLVRALDPGAFRGDHGNSRFTCPHCSSWRAEVTSPSLWYCEGCDHAGTRFGLVQLVLADAFAAIRLATGGVA